MIITKNKLLELPFDTYTNRFFSQCTLKRIFFQDFSMFGSRDIPASDVFFPKTINL